MKHKYKIAVLLSVLTLLVIDCSGPSRGSDDELLGKYLEKASFFWDDGQIDSSLHYVERCLEIDNENSEALYLSGKIYLYKDGIYNRRFSAESLRKAVMREKENAEYHYSLGETLEKQGYFQNALHEYEMSAKYDSVDPRPLLKIAGINKRIGLRYDDRKFFERSLKASSQAAKIADDPGIYYQQAAALYQMGEYDSSLAALNTGLAVLVDSTPEAEYLMLKATNFVRLGSFDSASTVFEQARGMMSDIARNELDDIRYLIPKTEYMKLSGESSYKQKKIIEQFWGNNDPDPTTSINERKLEHYSRIVHAQLTFSVPDKNIEGWKTKRGQMYIRYGPPTSKNYVLGSGGDGADPPKWIWRYDQFDTPITLIFADTFLSGEFDFPFPTKSWTSADFDSDPSRLADMLSNSVPQTFDFTAGSGPLQFSYMPRQFKGTGGKTTVEIFVTVPYTELEFERSGEKALADLEWRQVLRYGSWRLADSIMAERTFEIRASQMENRRLSLADRLPLSSYPDSLIFAISIKDKNSNHIGIDTRDIRLRNFHTGQVELSDLILARRIDQPPGELKYKRSDLHILSNLDNHYFAGEPVWLYFEIYNLELGPDGKSSYIIRQKITQKRSGGLVSAIRGVVSGKDLREVSTSYIGGSIYSEENRILRIQLSDFEAGDYILTIEVEDQVSGQSARVSEEIAVYE